MIEACDVLVVGAGPAGLAAATRLRERGLGTVVVIDRDPLPGGIPRHCGHSPFGMREFARILTGPAYAQALADRARKAGVELRLATTLVGIDRGQPLVATVTSDAGMARLMPQRILLATGVRETPRSARLIGGDRPLGVMTTGALQLLAERGLSPFRRPVIVGSELVALSALLTCRSIGARPVAMIEADERPTTRRPFLLLPRLLGVPVRYGAALARIEGVSRVEAVTLDHADGAMERLACDGVVLTGRFTPEATMVRAAGLEIDPGTRGPSIDQLGRTSDRRVLAAGNLLHPVETAGRCWAEARMIADGLADDLLGSSQGHETPVEVQAGPGIAYVVPQRLAGSAPGMGRLQIRVGGARNGRIVVGTDDGQVAARPRARLLPERRIDMAIPALAEGVRRLRVGIEE
ncbi:NAD(P)/FAD-dependent oxidoreductase [Ancylobacter sp. 6x-1]|uniref:NAD(P)/FAD-dependent oxidoreductase n=1 Tax=Ancylobacter crimeensis TaxID=2579147 RepID=A0ABT0D9P4_9HYPH|nr:FAD-dependent oxidoreductase [Ancylobacter crimeensis]MCK0196624.1 NAD(P)/FAD-dependent oxidoreductase [Ancylobacter crimeensis]